MGVPREAASLILSESEAFAQKSGCLTECRPGVLMPGRACLICELRSSLPVQRLSPMPDPLIERAEVVALLFNVSDIAVALTNIERLLGEDDGEEEGDES